MRRHSIPKVQRAGPEDVTLVTIAEPYEPRAQVANVSPDRIAGVRVVI